MQKIQRTFALFTIISILTLTLLAATSFAQEREKFALKGTTELGGSMSLNSVTSVNFGNEGRTSSLFSFSPYVGYFVTDGLEIGLNPLGIASASNVTEFMFFLAPSYNFRTEGVACPFVEGQFGYTLQIDGTTMSGFGWGGRTGLKLSVTDKGLLNIALEYREITLNRSGATSRNGYNQFDLSAGFTIWF